MDGTYEVPMNVALPMGANEAPQSWHSFGCESGAGANWVHEYGSLSRFNKAAVIALYHNDQLDAPQSLATPSGTLEQSPFAGWGSWSHGILPFGVLPSPRSLFLRSHGSTDGPSPDGNLGIVLNLTPGHRCSVMGSHPWVRSVPPPTGSEARWRSPGRCRIRASDGFHRQESSTPRAVQVAE